MCEIFSTELLTLGTRQNNGKVTFSQKDKMQDDEHCKKQTQTTFGTYHSIRQQTKKERTKERMIQLRMIIPRQLAIMLFILGFIDTTDAYAFLEPLTCHKYTNNGNTEKLCFETVHTGPSPYSFENGTTVYVGGYSMGYSFPKDDKKHKDLKISVKQDDNGDCTVEINGSKCNSCKVCGSRKATIGDNKAKVKADCTNAKSGGIKGRKTKCESVNPIFFPIKSKNGGGIKATNKGKCLQIVQENCKCNNEEKIRQCLS